MSQNATLQNFTYHRAPLSQPVTVAVSGDAISDGAVTLRFEEVSHIRHVSRGSRRIRSDYLDLTGRDNTRIRLACSGAAGRWGEEENSAIFSELLGKVMAAMVKWQPDLKVSVEDAKRWRWAWFVLGCITALLGIAIAGFAIFDGLASGRLVPVFIVMVCLAVFGVAIATWNVPWRPARMIPIATYSARFSNRRDTGPPAKSDASALANNGQ